MNRKILSILVGIVLLIGSMGMAFATESAQASFADMPDNWSTDALQKAVSNGLLGGYLEDGKQLIKAGNSLTRAEMATIVNRAFAAEKKGSVASVTDVAAGAWYAGEMAKAVKMGTFKLDTKMRPQDGITRQEAFTVLARAFKLGGGDAKALDRFSDKGDIAGWAQDSLAGMAAAGYIQGSDGKLQPKANITRAEFATVMDNLVKQYIDRAEEISEVADGNVIVRVPDVTLKDVTIKGDLIIADGVGEGDVTLDNVKVQGRTVVRGGGVDSIIVRGGSDVGRMIVAKVDGQVRIHVEGGAGVEIIYVDDGSDDVTVEGRVNDLEVAGEGVTVYAKDADVNNATVSGDKSKIVVADGSKVKSGSITGKSSAIVVDEGGSVDKVAVSGSDASVEGKGEVKEVEVKEGGDGASVSTPKTKVTVDEGVEGTTAAGDVPVEGGQTATNDDTGTGATVDETPEPGGGGGTSRQQVSAVTMTTAVVDSEGKPIDHYDLSALPYGAKVTVTLETATKDAKIYYTTDGTEPVAEGDIPENTFTITAGAVEIAATRTIKVLAKKDGHTDRAEEFTIKFKPEKYTLTFAITVVNESGKERVAATDAHVVVKEGWEENAEVVGPETGGAYVLETDKWYHYTITNSSGYNKVEGQVKPEGIEDELTLAITLVKVAYPDGETFYCSAGKELKIEISKLLHNQKNVKVGLPIYTGVTPPWASGEHVLNTMREDENGILWFIGNTDESGVLTVTGNAEKNLPYGSLRITLPGYGYTIDNTLPAVEMKPDVGITLGGFAYVADEDDNPVYLHDDVVVGQTLKAFVKPDGATVEYEWQRADAEDGEYTKITETASDNETYTLTDEDLGSWIRVKVTSTEGSTYKWGTSYSYPVGSIITAEVETFTVTFDVSPEGANIEVKNHWDETAEIVEPEADGSYKLFVENEEGYHYSISKEGYVGIEGVLFGPEDTTITATLIKFSPPALSHYEAGDTLEFTLSGFEPGAEVKVGLPISVGEKYVSDDDEYVSEEEKYYHSRFVRWASNQPVLTTGMKFVKNGLYWVGESNEEGVLQVEGTVGDYLPHGKLCYTLPDYGYFIDQARTVGEVIVGADTEKLTEALTLLFHDENNETVEKGIASEITIEVVLTSNYKTGGLSNTVSLKNANGDTVTFDDIFENIILKTEETVPKNDDPTDDSTKVREKSYTLELENSSEYTYTLSPHNPRHPNLYTPKLITITATVKSGAEAGTYKIIFTTEDGNDSSITDSKEFILTVQGQGD